MNGNISADMRQEFQSWSRMIHAASTDKKMAVLTNASREFTRHINSGRLEKTTTFDWLYEEGMVVTRSPAL